MTAYGMMIPSKFDQVFRFSPIMYLAGLVTSPMALHFTLSMPVFIGTRLMGGIGDGCYNLEVGISYETL